MNITFSTSIKALFLSISLLVLASCGGGGSNGTPLPTQINLPTGTDLTLACADVGITDNTCVLDDPINPYRFSIVNDETKWGLYTTVLSQNLYKAGFYLWATGLAQQQKGENQYYTGFMLQNLYRQGGSNNARNQAIKAYRSVLDNYFGDTTREDQNGTLVDVLVRNRVGEFMIEPATFPDLFTSQTEAYNTLRSWGYDYDFTANTVSRL